MHPQGGKSGLQRAERRATPGSRHVRRQRVPQKINRLSAFFTGARIRACAALHGTPCSFAAGTARQHRVKRRGKSPPLPRQRRRHGKPRSEQSQAAGGLLARRTFRAALVHGTRAVSWMRTPRQPAGRLHESAGDRAPREMVTLDRTRLIDLPFFMIRDDWEGNDSELRPL